MPVAQDLTLALKALMTNINETLASEAAPIRSGLGIEKLFTLTVSILLFASVLSGTSESMHAQMLKLGAYTWDDYFILRQMPAKPNCSLDLDINESLARLAAEHEAENVEFDLISEPFDVDATRASLIGQLRVCRKKARDTAHIY